MAPPSWRARVELLPEMQSVPSSAEDTVDGLIGDSTKANTVLVVLTPAAGGLAASPSAPPPGVHPARRRPDPCRAQHRRRARGDESAGLDLRCALFGALRCRGVVPADDLGVAAEGAGGVVERRAWWQMPRSQWAPGSLALSWMARS